jgi:hypothetical protein
MKNVQRTLCLESTASSLSVSAGTRLGNRSHPDTARAAKG